MKILSKIALLLTLAGLLALLLSLAPFTARHSNGKTTPQIGGPSDSIVGTPRSKADSSQFTSASHGTGLNSTDASLSSVRMPAIRGESYYGWVQLPHGTRVELIQQNADNLIVRWEGTTVRVPQTAATT